MNQIYRSKSNLSSFIITFHREEQFTGPGIIVSHASPALFNEKDANQVARIPTFHSQMPDRCPTG